MFAASDLSPLNKPELYREAAAQLRALIGDETDPIANMANGAALIFHSLPRLNWAGFYLLKEGELVVGPFKGGPRACGSRSAAAFAGRRRRHAPRCASPT